MRAPLIPYGWPIAIEPAVDVVAFERDGRAVRGK